MPSIYGTDSSCNGGGSVDNAIISTNNLTANNGLILVKDGSNNDRLAKTSTINISSLTDLICKTQYIDCPLTDLQNRTAFTEKLYVYNIDNQIEVDANSDGNNYIRSLLGNLRIESDSNIILNSNTGYLAMSFPNSTITQQSTLNTIIGDVQMNDNVNIDGTLTFGGTSAPKWKLDTWSVANTNVLSVSNNSINNLAGNVDTTISGIHTLTAPTHNILGIINTDNYIQLTDITPPTTTTNRLYGVGGSLYYNGHDLLDLRIGSGTDTNPYGADAIAIGTNAGNFNQGTNAVAIGNTAGWQNQGIYSNAIGYQSNCTSQGEFANAMGYQATCTASQCVALGFQAQASGTISCAIGNSAQSNALEALAIGNQVRTSGLRSTCIGSGINNSCDDVIVLRTGVSPAFTCTNSSAFYVQPIRSDANTLHLSYNEGTKEVNHSTFLTFEDTTAIPLSANSNQILLYKKPTDDNLYVKNGAGAEVQLLSGSTLESRIAELERKLTKLDYNNSTGNTEITGDLIFV